jgi:predicted kinase
MHDARVILTTGIPACGKSTFADWLGDEHGHWELNLDLLRLHLSGDATDQSVTLEAVKLRDRLLAEWLQAGRKVVLSDTNADPTFRRLLIEQVLALGVAPADVLLVHFPVSLTEAKLRNARRVEPVPVHVLERMAQQLEAQPPAVDAEAYGLGYAEYTQRAFAV